MELTEKKQTVKEKTRKEREPNISKQCKKAKTDQIKKNGEATPFKK